MHPSVKAAGILLAVAMLASCGMETADPNSIEGEFTVIWDAGGGLSPERHVLGHLQEKYPETSYQVTPFYRTHVILDGNQANHPDVYAIAENDMPGDIIVFESTLAPYLFKTGYLEPLDHDLDTILGIVSRMDGRAFDFARMQGGGTLYGIPFGKDVYALYYNVSIFNELGLPHPADGMTWDAVFDLAWDIANHPQRGDRKALGFDDFMPVFSQFHFRFLDEFGMPALDSPLWERALEFHGRWRDLTERTGFLSNKWFGFMDGQLAMLAAHFLGDDTPNGYTNRPFAAPLRDEWNAASFPVFADAPDTGPAPAYYYLGIPKNSRRKHEAFQLIAHSLTDEVQLMNSRLGLASVLDDPETMRLFGERDSRLHGKHTAAFFHHREFGSLDPDYDWQFERINASGILNPERLTAVLDHRREKLETFGEMPAEPGDESAGEPAAGL